MTETTHSSTAGVPIGAPRHLVRSRLIVAVSGPVAIGAAMLLGWLVSHSFNVNYGAEMIAAAVISLAAGMIAVLPLLLLMHRGVIAIVRLTMLATALRIFLVLFGLVLALGPGWKLSHTPLIIWAVGCYLALLIAESTATAWVVKHG